MGLIVAGVNHRTAPIPVRERLVFAESELRSHIGELRESCGAREMVVLSTCNRTEVYAVEGERDAVLAAWTLFSDRLGSDVTKHGYARRERDTAAHLFRVAAGMDSMILGEAQIHGQVRDAWEASRGGSRVVLNRLFQTALHVSARIREETAIARGAASVSSAAVQLGKKIFGSLQGRRAMVLGAGDTASLALECLVSEGVETAVVANRTFERACELAHRFGAEALHYDECWSRLHLIDLMLCSTASPHAVVETVHITDAVRQRGDRPLCILDLALPRDVSPDVRRIPNVFLYDLDDLQGVVSASLDRRRAELPQAERVVDEEAARFWVWLGGLAAVPVLTEFRSRLETLRSTELSETMHRLRHLAPDDVETIEQFSRALMNKFLHEPSVRVRAAAGDGRALEIVDALRYLFALRTDSAEAGSDSSLPNRER